MDTDREICSVVTGKMEDSATSLQQTQNDMALPPTFGTIERETWCSATQRPYL